jgi:NAD(P)-dependent dehydrogenase (short-subunit alcohol dehydrogenase family)
VNEARPLAHVSARAVASFEGNKSMAGRLEGKIAIITGAGSGIGLATARRFHGEGALLVLAGRSEAARNTATELGERAVGIRADVASAADVEAIVDLAISEYGGLDILCNVAGADPKMVLTAESTEAAFDEMIDVNLRGVFLTMKAAIPHLLAGGGGAIVNVASSAALIGTPSLGSYNAAKSGVLGLTRTVALEYAAQGIRANTVCPGVIATPMMDRGTAGNPEASEYLKQLIPMRRIGSAEEVADGMLFLASDESSYVTGIALPIEGGQTAG